MDSTNLKVCFVASSGGHWEELMCLKTVAMEHDSFFVSEAGGQIEDSKLKRVYTIPQINRKEKNFLLHFVKLFKRAKEIIDIENPDVIITTGALMVFPFCVIAKLKRKKVIYIESFARVKNKSLTGRLVYYISDLFLVQWEPLLNLYPKAKFVGGIF